MNLKQWLQLLSKTTSVYNKLAGMTGTAKTEEEVP